MKCDEIIKILINNGATSKNKSIKSSLFRKEFNQESVNYYLKKCKKTKKIDGEKRRGKDVNGNERDDLWHWWLIGK